MHKHSQKTTQICMVHLLWMGTAQNQEEKTEDTFCQSLSFLSPEVFFVFKRKGTAKLEPTVTPGSDSNDSKSEIKHKSKRDSICRVLDEVSFSSKKLFCFVPSKADSYFVKEQRTKSNRLCRCQI